MAGRVTLTRSPQRPGSRLRHEVVSGLVVGALAWLFIWIADEVGEGETLRFDRNVLEAIHAHTTPALVALAHFFTGFGPPLVWISVAVGVLVLWLAHQHRTAVIYLAASALTAGANEGLKVLFGRARPELWPHPFVAEDSFPSGHAMLSPMVYGVLAVLAARRWPRARPYVAVGATLFILAIAASRAVLGVHWPTDLIAGLALGTVCGALTLWTIDVTRSEVPRSD